MRLVGPRKGRYIYAISAKHFALEYSIDKAVAPFVNDTLSDMGRIDV